jgi:hypothetical protein
MRVAQNTVWLDDFFEQHDDCALLSAGTPL